MKSVLFATSALVALAGTASAEVAVSGDARLGLRYDNNLPCVACVDGTRTGWNVVNRVRVKFAMTGETDSGLSFGAEVRADQSSAARANLSNGTGVVWIKGSYGKLSAGDVDSALENAVGDLPEVGLTGLNYYNETFYAQTGVQDDIPGYAEDAVLLYEYKMNDFSIYASFQDQFLGYSGNKRGSAWSLGAGYTAGNYTFGMGYEKAEYTYLPGGIFTTNDSSTWGISGGTSLNGITFKAIFAQTNVDGAAGAAFVNDAKLTQMGVGAEYKMANGVMVSGFWRNVKTDFGDGAGSTKQNMYGIGAGYDLGGGAVVKGGIARAEGIDGAKDTTVADFGVALSF